MAFQIGLSDFLQLVFRNSPDFQIAFRFILQDGKGVFPEFLHNVFCQPGTDSFDQSGCQITLYAVFRLRDHFLALCNIQLIPIFAIHPFPIQFHLDSVCERQAVSDCGKPDQVVFFSDRRPIPFRNAGIR